jgi:hypothetical protein
VKRLFALLPLASLVAACAGGMSGTSAPTPPPFDPSGVYDATVETTDGLMVATLNISSTADGYTGSMAMPDMGSFPLTDIAVADTGMTFLVTNPFGQFLISLTFEGDKFTGTYESDSDGGYLSGTKRR